MAVRTDGDFVEIVAVLGSWLRCFYCCVWSAPRDTWGHTCAEKISRGGGMGVKSPIIGRCGLFSPILERERGFAPKSTWGGGGRQVAKGLEPIGTCMHGALNFVKNWKNRRK